jgi:hypothetical protein
MMKKIIFIVLLGLFNLGATNQAQAAYVDATPGVSSFSLWDISWDVSLNGGDGSVQYDAAVGAEAIKLTSPTAPGPATQVTTNAPTGEGAVSFNWFVEPEAQFDPFLFIQDLVVGDVHDVRFETIVAGGCAPPFCAAGNALFSISDSALWGFSLASLFGGSASMVTISNLGFAAARPSEVPLPPAFLLFGAALFGLRFLKRHKQAAEI